MPLDLTFGSVTVSWGLLVVCVALFYLWMRAESKRRKERRARGE